MWFDMDLIPYTCDEGIDGAWRATKKIIYNEIRTNDKLPQFSCPTTVILCSVVVTEWHLRLNYIFIFSLFGFVLDVFVFCICCVLLSCIFNVNLIWIARRQSSAAAAGCLLPQMRTNARLNFEHNLLNLITITYVFTQPHRVGIEFNNLVLSACPSYL